MEALAAGRGIALPAGALLSKMLTNAAGAYVRLRRQFKVPIGDFEGIKKRRRTWRRRRRDRQSRVADELRPRRGRAAADSLRGAQAAQHGAGRGGSCTPWTLSPDRSSAWAPKTLSHRPTSAALSASPSRATMTRSLLIFGQARALARAPAPAAAGDRDRGPPGICRGRARHGARHAAAARPLWLPILIGTRVSCAQRKRLAPPGRRPEDASFWCRYAGGSAHRARAQWSGTPLGIR